MNVYDFIKAGQLAYEKSIQLDEGWEWSMKEHLRRSFLYKNSQFYEENDNRDLRPNKNIVLGILNVQYRLEGFDVKDIELFIDDKDNYYKSFLSRKFHDKWALENQIDTFIDDLIESYVDYGGVLVRDTNSKRPDVVDLRALAFCNQRNILAHPFCIKHSFSPSELREQEFWGQEASGATISVEELISLCKDKEEIEVFELHGTLPKEWLKDKEGDKKDFNQIHVVAFYQKENGDEQGVTLFRKKEPKLPFKFLSRDQIIGRALGRGAVEELFEPQQWTSWSESKLTELMEASSKVVGITDDPTFAAKHPSGLKDIDNFEFIEVKEGKQVRILDNYPRNAQVFNNALERWQAHAQQLGSASELLMGDSPSSGMPFKLFEAKTIEDKSMHRFRQGKIAVFVDEIYRDWILKHITSEIVKDQEFLSDIPVDELQEISNNVAIKRWNEYIKEQILSGKTTTPQEKEAIMTEAKQAFLRGGTKRFISILKDEMKKGLSVRTNIVGKQKNLALMTDKLVSVLRQFITTPQIKQDPEMLKILNVILESSGMSPIMFGAGSFQSTQPGNTEPLKELAAATKND